MSVEYRKMIYREDLQKEPDTYFLFGDNLQEVGLGGQAAEMRGEPNAIGIPTKRKPSWTEDSFFSNNDIFEACFYIDKAFDRIPVDANVVVPEDGLGTGLAELPTRCPYIYKYILNKIEKLKEINKIKVKNYIYRLDIEKYNPWIEKSVEYSAYCSSKEKCRDLMHNFNDKLDVICMIKEHFNLIEDDNLYEGKEQYIIKGIDDKMIYYNCYIKRLKII